MDKAENKYIKIVETPHIGKTKGFDVWNKTGNYIIAQIYWYSNWRQYCVHSIDDMIYNSTCLELITEFLREINIEHRKSWNQKKEDK